MAAGKSRRRWGPEDRLRLREQCLARRPWLGSTGPRTAEGKRRSAANGMLRRPDPQSVRQARAAVADVCGMISGMSDLRRLLAGLQ